MNKYKNTKITVDGITFDSKAEYRRYSELRIIEKAGEISNLSIHIKIPFCPPPCKKTLFTYIADFTYLDNKTGKTIYEDVKGYIKTPVYNLKKKLLKEFLNIEIQEIYYNKKTKKQKK